METVLPFADQSVGSRHRRIVDQFETLAVDALLVTSLANVRWLTGFSGSNGFVVLSGDRFVLVTDNRYQTSAAAEVDAANSMAEVMVPEAFDDELYVGLLGLYDSVGFEAEGLSWKKHETLGNAIANVELVPTTRVCEKQRRFKDEGEQNLLAKAANIADEALRRVAPIIGPGSTERQIAAELDVHMKRLGAEDAAYETIVASGPNSALPHARPTDRRLQTGDLLIVDVGARVHGYGSDMTRTFVVGAGPTDEQQRWYNAVLAAQQAGVAALGVDVEEHAIDEICRSVLADFGFEEAFIHGTGHGIGLEIHEDPVLSPRSSGTLHSGLVITVEPGIYFPGVGGVRIEDAVSISDPACTTLTKTPKSLNPTSIK